MSLSYNKLSGPFPAFLTELPLLESLLLGGNAFTVEIPPCVGQLKHLTTLYLFQNKLEGPIPEELGGCRALRKALLNGNGLSGKLPDALSELDDLEELVVSSNALEGAIPDGLGRLRHLQTLDIQENKFGPGTSSGEGRRPVGWVGKREAEGLKSRRSVRGGHRGLARHAVSVTLVLA